MLNGSAISGAVQFIAVGPRSLITLWDKTRTSVQVKGVGAIATYPLYVNVRNPAIKTDAHFTTSPFAEQELKVPGARTLTTNYKILGGPATALIVAATTKFRDENPKTYKAFYDALAEAIAIVNKDKRAAASAYLEQTKDTKNTVDDIYAMIQRA